MDQECVELFEKEAARRNMSLSTFLQDAGLLCVAQEPRLLQWRASPRFAAPASRPFSDNRRRSAHRPTAPEDRRCGPSRLPEVREVRRAVLHRHCPRGKRGAKPSCPRQRSQVMGPKRMAERGRSITLTEIPCTAPPLSEREKKPFRLSGRICVLPAACVWSFAAPPRYSNG